MTAAILAPHTGRRCRPSIRRRLTARWHARRTRKAIEAARDEAYFARIEHHEPSPAVAAACAVTALTEVTDALSVPPVPAWVTLQPQTGTLPAAMADVDGDRPWKYQTGQWPTYKEIVKGEQ